MKLTVLGCNGPYPAENGATAGYLVETGAGFTVLDMGSGVFSRLMKLCKPEDVSAVILSHLHHDHISDMGVFNYYLELLTASGKFQGKIPCYVPPATEETVRLEKLYPSFKFIGVKEGGCYNFAGANAEFYKLRHGATNYGVRLTEEKSGRRLVYSGDSNVCSNLERLLTSCDLWLGDAPYIGEEYPEDGGHLSVEVMQALAEKYKVQAVLSHLCPMHAQEEYEKACTKKFMQVANPFKTYNV